MNYLQHDRRRSNELSASQSHYFNIFSETMVGLMERQGSTALNQRLIEEAVSITNADFGFIHLVDNDIDRLKIEAVCNADIDVVGKIFVEKGVGVAGTVWESADSVLVNDYENWSNRYVDQRISAMKSAIGVPMLKADVVVGVIGLGATTKERFTHQDIEIMWQFSHLAMIALDNTSLIEELSTELVRSESLAQTIGERESRNRELLHITQRRLTGAQTLIAVSELVSSTASMDDIADQVADETRKATDCDKVGIYQLFDHEPSFVEVGRAETDQTATDGQDHESMELGVEFVRDFVDRQSSNLTIAPQANAEHNASEVDVDTTASTYLNHSILISEIRKEATTWGLVVAIKRQSDSPFNIEDQQMLDGIANQLSLAVLQRDLVARMEYRADHDELTGLPNRRLFKQRLQNLHAPDHQSSSKAEILMIDLDGFKAINDQYGHQIGDQLLIEVAERLTQLVPDSATVARLGGDEFAVLTVSVTGLSTGGKLADQILRALQQPFSVGSKMLQIDASIGICSYPEDGTDFSTLLTAADSAMYSVKRNGKSGIKIYSQSNDDSFELSEKSA